MESIIETCSKPLGDKNLCDYSFESFECFWEQMRKYAARILQFEEDFDFLVNEEDQLRTELEIDNREIPSFDEVFEQKNSTLSALLKKLHEV